MKTFSSSKKQKQLAFFKPESKSFGGELLHGRRRRRRPTSCQHSLHVILRSSWARGPHSFRAPRNLPRIERLIRGIARKFRIKVYRQAIVGNHIHLIIGFGYRESYKSFVRLLSGQIASHVMGQQSFKVFRRSLHPGDTPGPQEPQGKGQQFFQFRPFTRVLNWGRDFQTCAQYVRQNALEAIGAIPYRPRKKARKMNTS
jgi:REP element-mobilizing transposase RayT